MADALTDYIVNRTRSSSPVVLKYVPYGALVEVRDSVLWQISSRPKLNLCL